MTLISPTFLTDSKEVVETIMVGFTLSINPDISFTPQVLTSTFTPRSAIPCRMEVAT